MVSPVDTRRLLHESAPVAVILLFWVCLSSFVRPTIAAGLLRAGMIMALLYTVVCGVRLARAQPPTPQPSDLEGILRENVRILLPAGAWFLVAQLVYLIEHMWDLLGIPGWDTSPAEGLSFVFIGTGVAVVLLYAIAIGLPRVRGQVSSIGDDVAGSTTLTDD